MQTGQNQDNCEMKDRFYHILFENSLDAILVLDSDLKIVEANQRACEILRYTKEKLLSLTSNHIFSPELLKKVSRAFKALSEKRTLRVKAEIVAQDGVQHCLSAGVRVFDSPEGTFAFLLLSEPSGNEISEVERDQLIKELKQKKKDLTALTEVTANAISTLRLDELLNALLTHIVSVMKADAASILLQENDHLYTRASIGIEEAVASKYTVYVGEGFAGTIAAKMEPLYIKDAQADPRVLNPHIRKRGIRSMIGVPLKRNGTFIGVLHVDWLSIQPYDEREIRLLEITAERCTMAILNSQLYEETKQLRDYLQLQINRMPIGCIVWDTDFKVKSWNPAAEMIFGFTAEEVIGKHAYDLIVPKEVQPHIDDIWQRLLEGDMTAHSENENITKAGRTIVCQWANTPLRKSDSTVIGVLSMAQDITEKKKIEAQFHRAQRMESIGVLAGGIAHDLNNILQPIVMSLQLLRRKFEDDKSQRLIDILNNSADRGAKLVRQILSLTRGLEGEHTIVQVKHIISELQEMLEVTFPKSIQVKSDISKELWNIQGDPTKLHQVFMNLCVNARDAMPEGGNLNISAENIFIDENFASMNNDTKVGPFIVITVSDTGVGIPAANLEKIFDPFYTTKEIGKGTGLGLSTSLNIVNAHGGFIRVQSEIGKGTKFNVYLPAIETDQTNKLGHIHAEEIPKAHGEMVLVVDDEPSIREITKMTLEASGYRAITANDGAEAIAVYLQNRKKIKVGIIDSIMPIMDGQATARALRKISPEMKLIIASGFNEVSKITDDTGIHTDFILSKPYTSETLLKTLHKVINSNT